MFRNMVTSFLDKEHIRTTLPRAKALRPIAERMITLGKRESLHARRQALAFIRDPAVVSKLFATIAPRFAQRPGGYTRIVKLGFRDGDGAQVAILEMVGSEFKAKKDEAKTDKKKKGKDAAAEEASEKKPKAEKAEKGKKKKAAAAG
jgi:large subunit ribosomal protein L17